MTAKNEYLVEKKTSGTVRGRLVWASLLAMSTATAANLGLYAIAGYLFPRVTAWPGTSPIHIIGATIVYLLLATLVFAVVKKLLPHPERHYLIIATVSLIISLGPPISLGFRPGLPGVPLADPIIALTLGLMHVISYAISVPLFVRMALD